MWILAQGGLAPWSLELVVEIAGQVLQPYRGVPSEDALAFVQFLLQSGYIQLPGRDFYGEWEGAGKDRHSKVAGGGFSMWRLQFCHTQAPRKTVRGRTAENADLNAIHL